MTPGVHLSLPHADYLAAPALSASGLRLLRRSPRHFQAMRERPTEATPAMRAGTLLHCAVLEPQAVADRYVVLPEDAPGRPSSRQWNAKKPSPETVAAIDWWRAFESQNAGKELISAEQLQTAQLQAQAVRALPDVAALLGDGSPEVSAFWIDPESGVLCKCRPDFVSPAGDAGVILLDVKTCQDASPAGFARSVANFGYHLQDVHYSEGFELASGKRVLGFVFAAVESEYPHAAAAYMLDDVAHLSASATRRRLISLYADCVARDEWKAYPETVQPLALPAWAL